MNEEYMKVSKRSYPVRLVGSKKTIKRSIYLVRGRYFVIYDCKFIEVKQDTNKFFTLEKY